MKFRIINKVTAFVALSFLVSVSASAETIMKVATWLPPTHVQNAVVWPTWGKWVSDATEGRVKIELEYGMGHPKTMFDLVEDGVVDASFSYQGYVPGRFKLTQGIEQPLLGAGSEAASVAHWKVHQKYFAKAEEHEGLELIGLFAHGPGQIHLVNPISSLSDLAGKKIRVGGGIQGEIAHRMGVTAVGAPAPKVYEMMQQGVIDGVFLPVAEQKYLRLKEIAPNLVVLPGGMYLGSFGIFMNPDFLDSLDPKDRKAILSVSGEKLSAMAGKAWDEADKEGLAAAKEAGVNVIMVKADDPMAKEFVALTKGMDEDFYKMTADTGVDTKAALAELRELARSY